MLRSGFWLTTALQNAMIQFAPIAVMKWVHYRKTTLWKRTLNR